MKVTKKDKLEVIEFNSIHDLYNYITETPLNKAFQWAHLQSSSGSESFTKTSSFEQASDLLRNGWKDGSEKLTKALKVEESKMEPIMRPRQTYDVQGYQASVPRYLQGIPTSMVTKKNVPIKQKVITVSKSIDYNGGVSANQIQEESIKAFMIIKKLESQGYRVNLNLTMGTSESFGFLIKIRVKNANEKLNISKMAFPIMHPSMLRRIMFRFIEVYPKITKEFVHGYGMPMRIDEIIKNKDKDEVIIPSIIHKDIKTIKTVEDLYDL